MSYGNNLRLHNGNLYVPFHSAPLAGGVFLPSGADSLDEHLELPPEARFCQGIWDYLRNGARGHRPGLRAARVHGNSMIEWGIFDGDFIIFQSSEFNYLHDGHIAVIEKVGDEPGFSAWSLKRFTFEPPLSKRDEFGEEIGSNNPTVRLRPHNHGMKPWELDAEGEYIVRGIFLRAIRPEEVRLVDSEMLMTLIREEGTDELR
jgi:hypothetical protein